MFGHSRQRKYKVAHARDRIRFTPQEVLELKNQVRGHIETKTILDVHDLKTIQEQNEKQVQDLEDGVTDTELDRSYVVPVYNKKTRERHLLVQKQPNPIYYQEHSHTGITIKVCRTMCLVFSILLLFLNIYFTNMWIYCDYYFPLEFFRMQFSEAGSQIKRLVLEFTLNLYLSILSFMYAMWGISISTVFRKPEFVAAFFTWGIPFIFPFVLFGTVQIVNLASLDTARMKELLFHSLWKFGYDKVTPEERYAWNQAQYTLKCCGVDSYRDWFVDWGYWINRTDKPSLEVDLRRVPESCCPNYTLHHEDGYILRTRNYAIRMLYCQYYPNDATLTQGCFFKLIVFFQSFTEQLVWVALFKIGLMVLAAVFAFLGHLRYKRLKKSDHNYTYTWRDWPVDCLCIRCCKNIKDARKKRVGPAPLNLAFHDRPMDKAILERRRPHLIDQLPKRLSQLEQNEEEAALDEEARQEVAGLINDPMIDIIQGK